MRIDPEDAQRIVTAVVEWLRSVDYPSAANAVEGEFSLTRSQRALLGVDE